jgi:hypothetical protein
MLICNRCKNEKIKDDFYKRKSPKTGRFKICKECMTKAAVEWRKQNPERVKRARRLNDLKNIKRYKKLYRIWRKENFNQCKKYLNNWKAENPGKVKAADRRKHEKQKDLMNDAYLKRRIYFQFGIKAAEVTPKMLEFKYSQLSVYRAIKAAKEAANNQP